MRDRDRPLVEAFLARHSDTSMILRGNLHNDGIEDRGGRLQGTYAGAFDAAGALRAVAAHYRIGNVLAACDSDPALDVAVLAAVAASRREVKGLIGARAIVRRMREVLGLLGTPALLDNDEGLYALELSRLRVPLLLRDPEVEVRALRPEDRALLTAWYQSYDTEALNAEPSEATAFAAERRFDTILAEGFPCLLLHRGAACATTGFNAQLPDSVQIGGVYTPPEARSRGYARAVVAASLVDAAERGAKRAILFTGEENQAAIKAYAALGFERIGDFNITLFASDEPSTG